MKETNRFSLIIVVLQILILSQTTFAGNFQVFVEQDNCDKESNEPVHITVGRGGDADFAGVQVAVDSVPRGNTQPVVIYIEPGTYKERVVVPRTKRFIHFRGRNAEKTILTYDLNARMKGEDGKEIGTFRTPSVTIEADDFSAEGITFENSAGPVGQALAITVIGDRVVFRNCRFLGWQDTLLDQTGRHYYENCYIEGHCDFIFGGGTAFFENCHIHCLRDGYITAAATPQHQRYGYVFSNCKITGEPGVRVYLGRPWRDYANVIFMNTEMSDVIRPEGWHNWDRPHREKTSRYAEYNSSGHGAKPEARVEWARRFTEAEAEKITVESVLSGKDGWDPLSGKVDTRLQIEPGTSEDVERFKEKVTAETSDGSAYLVTAFEGNGESGLYYVCSKDAVEWELVGGPFLKPQAGEHKLMKDPALLRGCDGKFHLVRQCGLKNEQGLGYAHSGDLVNFSQQKFLRLMAEHKPYDVTSPGLFYDETQKSFIIIWASTLPYNYYQAFQEDVEDNPRLWYTTTKDFVEFAPAKIFFEPGYSVTDGTILKYGSRYVLVHMDNRKMMNTLRVTFADSASGPWGPSSDYLTGVKCDSPFTLKAADEYIVYFEMPEKGRYGAVKTTDFKTWTDITEFVSFPADYHYGSALKVGPDIFKKLRSGV